MGTDKVFWHDGSQIRSSRIKAAFREGILTRRHVYPSKVAHFFAQCTESECQGDFNFSQTNTRQFRQQKCLEHSFDFRVVDGRKSWSKKVINAKQDVVFTHQTTDSGLSLRIPWLVCATLACDRRRRLDKLFQNAWFCQKCIGNIRRKRPFEALYLKFKKHFTTSNSGGNKDSLTYEQFALICSNQTNCHYCDRSVKRIAHGRVMSRGSGLGAWCLDRLDPQKGYTKENVVSCCSSCNFTKSVWLSEDEMRLLGSIRKGQINECMALLQKPDTRARLVEWGKKIKTIHVGGRRLESSDAASGRALDFSAKRSRLRPYEGIYNQFSLQAKQRKIKNKISYASFRQICETDNQCYYCSAQIFRSMYRSKGKGTGTYLDRKDNRQLYHVDNVVTACGACNMTRHRWVSFEEMQILGAIRSGKNDHVRVLFAKFHEHLDEWACMMRVFTPQMMHFWITGRARN